MAHRQRAVLNRVQLFVVSEIVVHYLLLVRLDHDALSLFGPPAPSAGSPFDMDLFGAMSQPVRDTRSPSNMFSATFPGVPSNPTNFFTQSQTPLLPMRLPSPMTAVPFAASPSLPIKNLNLNANRTKNDTAGNPLDLDESGPPPSPKFDPYA